MTVDVPGGVIPLAEQMYSKRLVALATDPPTELSAVMAMIPHEISG